MSNIVLKEEAYRNAKEEDVRRIAKWLGLNVDCSLNHIFIQMREAGYFLPLKREKGWGSSPTGFRGRVY